MHGAKTASKLAIADYTKAIESDPQQTAGYLNRGISYGNALEEYDKAIADYTQAIEINPQLADRSIC